MAPGHARQATGAEDGCPDRAEAAGPEHVALVSALAQLPDGQRRALVLHHIADLPVRDVATELGVAEGTVKARLSRGRAALAALLNDTPMDEPGASHV